MARINPWNRHGQVVYSDDASIIGRSFGASDELDEALDGEIASEVPNLRRAEQARDRHNGELVEVYVPLRFAPGARPAVRSVLAREDLPRGVDAVEGRHAARRPASCAAHRAVRLE